MKNFAMMKNAPKMVAKDCFRVTKAFSKNAMIFGTPEYKVWREVLHDHPNAKMVTKSIKKNPSKRTSTKNMTYKHMAIYISRQDDVGKSRNMLQRIAEHYVGIKAGKEKKYRIMAEAQRKGHSIDFDVLYYATGRTPSAIREEIGEKEGEYIRQYQPVLNTQIPKAENWHKFDINKLDAA